MQMAWATVTGGTERLLLCSKHNRLPDDWTEKTNEAESALSPLWPWSGP